MKLFDLSLVEEVGEWYLNFENNSYATLKDFLDGFREKWGENKEPRHQFAALQNIKNIENEMIEEFNTKFRRVVADLHDDINPNNASILIYYIEYFFGDLRYCRRIKLTKST